MANLGPTISSFPNELIMAILSILPTDELHPLVSINRQFHALVITVLHARLLQTASLPHHKLILEAYHPTSRHFTPYLSCRYLRTILRDGSPHADQSPTLSDLWNLYSIFHPKYAEGSQRPRRIRSRFVVPPLYRNINYDQATHQVILDDGELFSQLCACVNVVKEGAVEGLFVAHVNIVDGFVRIFRKWLEELADQSPDAGESAESRLIWMDNAQNVGIRFRLIPGPSESTPLASGPDENPPISYTIEYEELLVRVSRLLKGVETADAQEYGNDGLGKTLILPAIR